MPLDDEPSREVNPGEQSPPGQSGSGPREPPSRRSDRDLIQAALDQASPRPETVVFGDRTPLADTFPGFEILREIHRGGQGVVYQALQKTTRRKVAIKVIHGGPFTGSSGRARFEREVQVLGQLDHPNIVGIHDSGVTPDGSFYYVMDYISGQSLDEVLRAEEKPPVDRALKLFIKICDAVNAAHLKGVIHRDLKPANIRIDSNGEPIVVDFGLAKIAGPDVTEYEDDTPRLMTITGQFIGSLPWASPEQAQGTPGKIDVRTDVYSLGVVLYQMLTGKFPYQVVGTMRDVLDNILKAEPARPSTIRRQINNEVETIVLKCLSKERERRYQNAGELARDLRHYLAGEPIEAKRDSGLYVVTKTLQRYKAAALVAGAFVVTILVFGIVMTVLYRQAETARGEAMAATGVAKTERDKAEEERRRAQASLAAGIDLARKTVFDIQTRIKDLRGATAAREAMLKDSAEFFERVEQIAGTDPAVLRTIAAAFDQLGDLQGDLFEGRLAESGGMERHYARARAIRERLAESNPDTWWKFYELAESEAREAALLQAQNKLEAAAAKFSSAVEKYDRALSTAPLGGIPTDQEKRTITRRRADANKRAGQALLLYAELSIQAGNFDRDKSASVLSSAQTLLERVSDVWSAEARERADDTAAAVESVRSAATLADAMVVRAQLEGRTARVRASATPSDALGAAQSLSSAAAAFGRAREMGLEAAGRADALVARAEISRDAQRLAATTRHTVGNAWMLEAELRHALESQFQLRADGPTPMECHVNAADWFQQAFDRAAALAAADSASLSALRDMAQMANKLAKQQLELGDVAGAETHFAASLDARRRIHDFDRLVRYTRDLGLGQYRMAVFLRRTADADTNLELRAARYAGAARHLEDAEATFSELVRKGAIKPDGAEMRAVTQARASLFFGQAMLSEMRGNTAVDPAKKNEHYTAAVAVLKNAEALITSLGPGVQPESHDVTASMVADARRRLSEKMGK